MKSDAFSVNHTTAELELGGDQIALTGIKLQTFLAADCEHRLESTDESVCVFCVTKHVVEPDEQVQVREQRLQGGLEVRNGIRGTVKNAARSEDSKRRV